MGRSRLRPWVGYSGWIDSLPATDERRDSMPMGRYGTADEIAATVAFLLSEGAGDITGQNVRVDGGSSV